MNINQLLQPKFASYLSVDKRYEIRDVVGKVADLFASPEIAINDHGPKLYSKFLRGLLDSPLARVDPTSPPGPSRKARPTLQPSTQGSNESQPSDRASSISLSPAPRQEALSFDTFAPIGSTDPFVPSHAGATNSLALHIGGTDEYSMSDFFNPPLPFDDAIMRSMQSLTGEWQDTLVPSCVLIFILTFLNPF